MSPWPINILAATNNLVDELSGSRSICKWKLILNVILFLLKPCILAVDVSRETTLNTVTKEVYFGCLVVYAQYPSDQPLTFKYSLGFCQLGCVPS